jgi:hypothetical protein
MQSIYTCSSESECFVARLLKDLEVSRGASWRIRCGGEVTELSTYASSY